MVVSILVVMGASQGTFDPASLHASGWLLLVSGRFACCHWEDGQRGASFRRSIGRRGEGSDHGL